MFKTPGGYVGHSAISPSGTMIAVLTSRDEGFTNRKLVVLTTEGKEITSFLQGGTFAWRPDSRLLAYSTGTRDGGEFTSTGIWLYDQRFMTTTKIYDKGTFLDWSPFDHHLYIWDDSAGYRRVLRYEPRTQTVLVTNYRGISFSPTGRYYHTAPPPYGTEGLDLYETKANQSILGHRPKLADLRNHARVVGWAPEGDVLILEVFSQGPITEAYPQGRVDTVLYDVAHDIARVIQDDSVIGWQNGQAIVHDRGKFSKRPLTALSLLPETPERPEKPPGIPSSRPQP